MRKILGVYSSTRPHWVGDGFPVRSMFSYATLGQQVSPFLLLDYAGPVDFAPAEEPRGVGAHPHRGFETVTIVYKGEVEHQDSTGNGGVIGPGNVQWMTAASGILHKEFHSRAFTRKGGTLEMVQLWVNLPAKDKDAAPGYQAVLDLDIPAVTLPDAAGTLRVIAGADKGSLGHTDQYLGSSASPGRSDFLSIAGGAYGRLGRSERRRSRERQRDHPGGAVRSS